jgi:hypothetical protein
MPMQSTCRKARENLSSASSLIAFALFLNRSINQSIQLQRTSSSSEEDILGCVFSHDWIVGIEMKMPCEIGRNEESDFSRKNGRSMIALCPLRVAAENPRAQKPVVMGTAMTQTLSFRVL